jgi:hypothetical protein
VFPPEDEEESESDSESESEDVEESEVSDGEEFLSSEISGGTVTSVALSNVDVRTWPFIKKPYSPPRVTPCSRMFASPDYFNLAKTLLLPTT